MRYRLMATYLGVPYHAGLGPDGTDVTLFSPGPPPEELGFTAAPGHWRKQVGVNDLSALWQSRLVGEYRGEPCMVLDDLGERMHIVYLGRDAVRARQLGYWEIDREVFEVVVARSEVDGLTEERVEFPLSAATFPPSSPAPPPGTGLSSGARPPFGTGPLPGIGPLPGTGPVFDVFRPVGAGPSRSREPEPETLVQTRLDDRPPTTASGFPGARAAAWHGSPSPEPWSGPNTEPWSAGETEPWSGPEPGSEARPEPWAGADLGPEPDPEPPPAAPPGRRTARKDRISPQAVFAELLHLAGIPQTAYAVDEEVPGAMCLVKTVGGFEVFSCTDDARLEVHFFEDEEAAYFYLFGVLAAEAIRSGRLASTRPNGYVNGYLGPVAQGEAPTARANVSKYLRG